MNHPQLEAYGFGFTTVIHSTFLERPNPRRFFHRRQLYGLAQLLYCDQLNDIVAGGATKVEERCPMAQRGDSFIGVHMQLQLGGTRAPKKTYCNNMFMAFHVWSEFLPYDLNLSSTTGKTWWFANIVKFGIQVTIGWNGPKSLSLNAR